MKKSFVFSSCERIFLDLPKIFYGSSSHDLKNKWDLESGALPLGLEVYNNGILFGFAPMVFQLYSSHFVIKKNKDRFSIHIEILPLKKNLEKMERRITFTKNNYFQYGYGEELLGSNRGNQAFYVKFLDMQNHLNIGRPFDESVKNCYDIAKKYNNLSLCFSGGVDSLAMLITLLHSKVDFKIYIWRDKNNLIIDSDIAVQICNKNGWKYEFVEIDVIKFLESGEYLEYCKNYKLSCLFEYAIHIKFLESTPGTPVLSSASEPVSQGVFNPFIKTKGYQTEDEGMYALNRYFLQSKREAVPHFFFYSVEQLISFVKVSEKCKLFDCQTSSLIPDYNAKCDLYRLSGFPFNTKYTQKYYGNEKIREYYAKKTGDPWFYDKEFRHKLWFVVEKEYYVGWTMEPNGLLHHPLNYFRDFSAFPGNPEGFKYYLRG